jgi:hypothetical protein
VDGTPEKPDPVVGAKNLLPLQQGNAQKNKKEHIPGRQLSVEIK